ncbi:MAG: InlB B-repeat-containing protein [Fibrobacterota bacterium]
MYRKYGECEKMIRVMFFLMLSFSVCLGKDDIHLFGESQDSWIFYTSGRSAYLIDNDGSEIHTWNNAYTAASNADLLRNGSVLFPGNKPGNWRAGGAQIGGNLRIISWNGEVVWDYDYSSADHVPHHDVEPVYSTDDPHEIPNFLVIVYEKKANTLSDKIVELKPIFPDSAEIVWEWKAWDHRITSSGENADKLSSEAGGGGFMVDEWTHANSLSYNPELEQIVLGLKHFKEFIIIDHSTTMQEASGSTGGRYGKGGSVLYRWGNPSNYGVQGENTINSFHCASWILNHFPGTEDELPGSGNILLASNSTNEAMEIGLPGQGDGFYPRNQGQPFLPANPDWTGSVQQAANQGSVQRLPTGNTFVASYRGSMVEITPAGETIWSRNISAPRAFRVAPSFIDTADGGTMYELNITAEDGTVQTDPEGSRFEEDTEVELTAVPDYGYEFVYWSGDISGAENPHTIAMDSDKHIQANFEEVPTYALSISSENGNITVVPEQERYIEGEEVELRACPDSGYIFGEWSGDVSGEERSITLYMDSDKSIYAHFSEHRYAVLDTSYVSVEYASSEDENRPAVNVLDGTVENIWFTRWEEPEDRHPHEIVLSIDTAVALGGLLYTPRRDNENGRIDEYEIYVSSEGEEWGEPVAVCAWKNSPDIQEAAFRAREEVSFIRLVALSEVNNEVWTSVANLDVLYESQVPIAQEDSGTNGVSLQGQVIRIGMNEPLRLRISSVSGRQLKTVHSHGPGNLYLADMGLLPGVYIVQVRGESDTVYLTRQVYIP